MSLRDTAGTCTGCTVVQDEGETERSFATSRSTKLEGWGWSEAATYDRVCARVYAGGDALLVALAHGAAGRAGRIHRADEPPRAVVS